MITFSEHSLKCGIRFLVSVFLSSLGSAACAGDNEKPQSHEHGAMQMTMPSAEGASGGMDMGEITTQGGSAPENSRSPHAYADGLSLSSGPYSLPGVPRLKMADEHSFWAATFNRFEVVDADEGDFGRFDGQAWFGRTYNRIVIKAEGEVAAGTLMESGTELLFSHAIASFWDIQSGIRHDTSEGPSRDWLALGFQGLAPYWFEIDGAVYVGEQGRSMLQIEVEYELLFTQRLILQPRFEATIYAQNDKDFGVGSGISSVSAGVRLRYEFTRQFAPYVGVEWSSKFGNTADLSRAEGRDVHETTLVAGLRFWF